MNKGELVDLAQQYLECEETTFVENIDQFIKLAEEDIYRQVQLLDLRKNSTSAYVVGSPYLSTPDDFLSVYSLAVIVSGEHRYVQSKDVNFLREAFPAAATSGVPRFYSMFDDDTFIVAPTPDDDYVAELHYYYLPTSLAAGSDSGTTWLSENAENALLFGTILHGYIYLKGDGDVIAMYQKQFDKAIADLKTIAEGRNRKDTYRTPDRRLPV